IGGRRMMRFTEVVAASNRVGQTGSRLAKRDAIAACLRAAAPEEIEIAVAFLSGEVRHGKLGIGYAPLSGSRSSAAEQPSLALMEIDEALTRLATTTGKGSASERAAQLHALFARATSAEQDFLFRLLVGEPRQGALEGVMIEAIAVAGELPVSDVRRAVMLAGNLPAVAR